MQMTTRHFKFRNKVRRLIISTDQAPVIGAMEGGRGHSPSEQSMIDDIPEYCPKMMHAAGNRNNVTEYLSRSPDPVTAICASLTSTPSVRFQVEMLAAAQDASADLLEGEDREVCSKEVIINGEPRCLVGLIDQETEIFRPILPLPVRALHDPLHTGPEKVFEIINSLHF